MIWDVILRNWLLYNNIFSFISSKPLMTFDMVELSCHLNVPSNWSILFQSKQNHHYVVKLIYKNDLLLRVKYEGIWKYLYYIVYNNCIEIMKICKNNYLYKSNNNLLNKNKATSVLFMQKARFWAILAQV